MKVESQNSPVSSKDFCLSAEGNIISSEAITKIELQVTSYKLKDEETGEYGFLQDFRHF